MTYPIEEFKDEYIKLFIKLLKATPEDEEPACRIVLLDGSSVYTDADAFVYYVAKGEVPTKFYMNYKTEDMELTSHSERDEIRIVYMNCQTVSTEAQYMEQIITKMEVTLDELNKQNHGLN